MGIFSNRARKAFGFAERQEDNKKQKVVKTNLLSKALKDTEEIAKKLNSKKEEIIAETVTEPVVTEPVNEEKVAEEITESVETVAEETVEEVTEETNGINPIFNVTVKDGKWVVTESNGLTPADVNAEYGKSTPECAVLFSGVDYEFDNAYRAECNWNEEKARFIFTAYMTNKDNGEEIEFTISPNRQKWQVKTALSAVKE